MAAGNRSEAITAYHGLGDIFVGTMGIPPSDQAEALYQRALG